MAKMNQIDLQAAVGSAIRDSVAFVSDKIADQRATAMKYYLADPLGNEEDGRSQVVMQEVADTVDWIMPALLKIFASGDNAVEFTAETEQYDKASKQATALCNYVFYKDNPGFMVFHTAFQDALIQKNGFGKVYWDASAKDEVRTIKDVSEDELAFLDQDPDIEILSEEIAPDSPVQGSDGMAGPGDLLPAPAVSYTVRYRKKQGKTCVENIPPEEFLISRDAKTIQTGYMVGNRTRYSISALIAMGVDEKQAKALDSGSGPDINEEAIVRRDYDDDSPDGSVDREGVSREVWVNDCYILIDYDGDGIAERRRVLTAGNGYEVLKIDGKEVNEEWSGPVPYWSITPLPRAHRFFGRSIADVTMDLQLIKSELTREMLNNVYLSNSPRNLISEYVNVDDYMQPRIGGYVRLSDGKMPGDGHVLPFETPFVAKESLSIIEWLDTVRENRTGVTKYNQGTDADSLNKTARGINQIMSAAQQRIELIARVFAETGITDMFKLILWCESAYQKEARILKINNSYEAIDPRGWESLFTMSINVGLGTGNKDQILMHLMSLLQVQQQAVQFQGGGDGPLVTVENIYHTCRKMVENAGLKDPELYFTDPEKAKQQPQQPKPDPEMEKMKAEMALKQQQMMLQNQIDQAKLQMQSANEEKKLELQKAIAVANFQLEQMKAQASFELQASKQSEDMDIKRETAKASAKPATSIIVGANGEAANVTDAANSLASGVEQSSQVMVQVLQTFMENQSKRDEKQDEMMIALMQMVGAPREIDIVRGPDGKARGARTKTVLQ